MPQIHLIENLKKQKPLDRSTHSYESGNWDVSEAKAQSLIGGRIYFHETQAGRSYFGGVITGFRVLPKSDPYAGRIVFFFTADRDGKGVLAGTDSWRNEQKTIGLSPAGL